jgi:hypothetical protein
VSVRGPGIPTLAVVIQRWFLAVLRDSMRLTDGTASCQGEDKGESVGDLREVEDVESQDVRKLRLQILIFISEVTSRAAIV